MAVSEAEAAEKGGRQEKECEDSWDLFIPTSFLIFLLPSTFSFACDAYTGCFIIRRHNVEGESDQNTLDYNVPYEEQQKIWKEINNYQG